MIVPTKRLAHSNIILRRAAQRQIPFNSVDMGTKYRTEMNHGASGCQRVREIKYLLNT